MICIKLGIFDKAITAIENGSAGVVVYYNIHCCSWALTPKYDMQVRQVPQRCFMSTPAAAAAARVRLMRSVSWLLRPCLRAKLPRASCMAHFRSSLSLALNFGSRRALHADRSCSWLPQGTVSAGSTHCTKPQASSQYYGFTCL